MKRILIFSVVLVGLAASAMASEYVNGYTRKDGTYVQGHIRSSPDKSYNNNYSTQGNYNPYSGKQGTEAPTYNNKTPEYNQKNYGNTYQYDNSYK